MSKRELFDKPYTRHGKPAAKRGKPPAAKPDKPKRLYDTYEAALAGAKDGMAPNHRYPYEDYQNGQYKIVLAIGRWNNSEGKEFKQASIDPESERWVARGMKSKSPPFNLRGIHEAIRLGKYITIVEGEKAADALIQIGVCATTSAGGCTASHKTDWSHLRGADVLIWPDKDEPGKKFARLVIDQLKPIANTVRIIWPDLSALPDKGDAYDWVEMKKERNPERSSTDYLREDLEAAICHYLEQHPDEAVADSSESIETVAAECIEAEADDDDGDGGEVESPPFPIDSLPPILGDYVKECADGIYPHSYLALPVIASLSSLLCGKRRVWITRKWKPDPIFWMIVVAESGSKKSVAHKAAMEELARINRQYADDYKEALRTYLQSQKTRDKSDPADNSQRPKQNRVYCTNTTTEGLLQAMNDADRPSLLLASDELNTWLESFTRYRNGNNSDMSDWLEFYNAGDVSIIRKDTTKNVSVNRAGVNVCGTIQPSVLAASLLKPSFVGSGFLSRCSFSFEPPIEDEQYDDEPHSPPLLKSERFCQFTRRLEALPYPYSGVDPFALNLTDQSYKLFKDYRMGHIADLKREALAMPENSLQREYWKSFVEKHREHPIRLVPLFHAAECIGTDPRADDLDKPISCETMERAIEVAKWFAHGAKKLCRMIADQPANYRRERLPDTPDEYVLKRIREGREMTLRDIAKNSNDRYKNSAELLPILTRLVESHLVTKRQGTAKNGASVTYYRLA